MNAPLAGVVLMVLVSGVVSAPGDEAPRQEGDRGSTVSLPVSDVHARSETRSQARTGPRHGRVRSDGRAFVDADGPFLARGATLFWAHWGYQHDRARLARNLATLRDWGFHYVRVLGQVGAPDGVPGDSWNDRRVDPNAEGYAKAVADFTDWAYREFGLRVQWTIFGGVDFTPTPEQRQGLVLQFAEMSRGREQSLFALEIANEGWQNGFRGDEGRRELQALGRLLAEQSDVLVALSSPQTTQCEGTQGIRALYQDAHADLATLHFTRPDAEAVAKWTLVEDAWQFRPCAGVPQLVSSNEPIGPESSVASLDDPLQLTALALATYGSGIGAFVMHSGPGVRGGGTTDLARGRHANVWELPTGSRLAAGLRTLGDLLPPDLPNWEKQEDQGGPTSAFELEPRGSEGRLYCVTKGQELVCAAIGVGAAARVTARRAMTVRLHDLLDGRLLSTQRLAGGGNLAVVSSSAAVLLLAQYE